MATDWPDNHPAISNNVVIMTRDDLEAIKRQCFIRGVERGRFEERSERNKEIPRGVGTAREAPGVAS